MIKSELIESITNKQSQLSAFDVKMAIECLMEIMCRTLADNDRIEIRGFGSFELRHRSARTGRNPKTGETVRVSAHYSVHFKPGKSLKERINQHHS